MSKKLMPYNRRIDSFIYSGCSYSASSSPLLIRGVPDYSTDTESACYAKAPQATTSEELAPSPYVATRIRTHDLSDERRRICQWAPRPHNWLIHSFIHSGHFYSAHSSPLLLRGAPDYSTYIVSEFHAEAHRQLQVNDCPRSLHGS